MTEAMQSLIDKIQEGFLFVENLLYVRTVSEVFGFLETGLFAVIFTCSCIAMSLLIYLFILERKGRENKRVLKGVIWLICGTLALLFSFCILKVGGIYYYTQVEESDKAIVWKKVVSEAKAKSMLTSVEKELSINDMAYRFYSKEWRPYNLLSLSKDNSQFSEAERKVINDCIELGKQPRDITIFCLRSGLFELEKSKAD